jgi:hypothetical protein
VLSEPRSGEAGDREGGGEGLWNGLPWELALQSLAGNAAPCACVHFER